MEQLKFRVVSAGNGGVGKSTFASRHLTGDFTEKYVPTEGKKAKPLVFNTNHGKISFEFIDTEGQEQYGKHRAKFFKKADAVFVMFDVTDSNSFAGIEPWFMASGPLASLKGKGPAQVYVLIGNKVDLVEQRKVPAIKAINFARKKNVQYFEMSALSNYQFEKPFLFIARELTGHKDLYFTAQPALRPAEVVFDEASKTEVEAALVTALAAPLPDFDRTDLD